MRTVISHFYNEEYLLPWWLKHHLKIFDFGILIDHGSTDRSVEICKKIAPHWRVVQTGLKDFNAWLTDFEVMNYELEIDGWKIALNTTEFLISYPSLDQIENFLEESNIPGVAASGMLMIDKEPSVMPDHDISLIYQKPWAIDLNRFNNKRIRKFFGYPETSDRNRFYHKLPNGCYTPGRHKSSHPAHSKRIPNLIVLHYAYSPWNANFIDRKLQISSKLNATDVSIGWGAQHQRNLNQLNLDFARYNKLPCNDIRCSPFLYDERSSDEVGKFSQINLVKNR